MDIESRIKRPRHVRIITVGNVEAWKGVDYGKTKVSIEGIEIMANIFDLSGHPVFKIRQFKLRRACRGTRAMASRDGRRHGQHLSGLCCVWKQE
ncbi:hypothetical protein MTO96_014959 [Rhipicephalus appendiculatus]